jgi:hypothetical protein
MARGDGVIPASRATWATLIVHNAHRIALTGESMRKTRGKQTQPLTKTHCR